MNVRRPRGTNDILPGNSEHWQIVEAKIREICHNFGYQEIRTPIFEYTELFERGIGDTTDIVEKEMYTFEDRGERSITLRPEGTAPVVRAFLENKLYAQPLPAKLYYLGPMFRYEKPQAGRYRQFYQFGVEAIGSSEPALDVEMINLPIEFYRACGLSGFQVHINSIGCPKCRPVYRDNLKEMFSKNLEQFCGSCQGRIERNPLRVLDCKSTQCQELITNIPLVLDSLCADCGDHFAQVREYLDLLGIEYIINPKLVRGFDYYTRTVFEITMPSLGAQNAIGGGGRYDGLVEECGGSPLPAVGFAVGLDRLMLSLEKQDNSIFHNRKPQGFVAHFGGTTKPVAIKIINDLRKLGLWVEMDYLDRSLRAQMKAANRYDCDWVVIVGDEELAENKVKVRWMTSGEEQEVQLEDISQVLVNEREGQE